MFPMDDIIVTLRNDLMSPTGLSRESFWEFLTVDVDRVRALALLHQFSERFDFNHLKLFSNKNIFNAWNDIAPRYVDLKAIYNNLTLGDMVSINFWTTEDGYQISFWLRDQPMQGVNWSSEFINTYTKFLDEALDKLPDYTETSVLWRIEWEELDVYQNFAVGDIRPYLNYIGTGKTSETSFFNTLKRKNFMLKINNDGSFPVKDIQAFSQEDTELEALIVRGKKLKFTHIDFEEHPNFSAWKYNQGNPSGNPFIKTIYADVID